MFLKNLYLYQFRAHKEAFFEFNPSMNYIHGANAQGKTTLLEAIHFLITGRSFRTSQVTDLIQLGASSFYIEASFVKHGIEQSLKVSCSHKERKIIYNNTQYSSSAPLIGLLQGVVITPDDDSLVKGAPVVRRHFIDLQIAQVDPLYVHYLVRYNRAMRHRNILLKAKSQTAIESWEYEMANAAAYLTQQRHHTIKDLEGRGKAFYDSLSGQKEALSLTYKTTAPLDLGQESLKQYYLEQFHRHRPRELLLGYTLAGPHKDDLCISIDQKEARLFASEGQQRSCVSALHFAQWEHLQELEREAPLMLIDDVGVSLDQSRKDKLFSHLKALNQIFITSTDKIPVDWAEKDCTSIKIEKSSL